MHEVLIGVAWAPEKVPTHMRVHGAVILLTMMESSDECFPPTNKLSLSTHDIPLMPEHGRSEWWSWADLSCK